MARLTKLAEEQYAEEATGCNANPHGMGKLYAHGGRELTTEEAQDALINGQCVEIPNAGAGSYRKVAALFGLEIESELDWTSSAGDWSFIAKDGEFFRVFAQENRYPHHGFRYTLGQESFESVEQLISFYS